jgi:hypothetical protein
MDEIEGKLRRQDSSQMDTVPRELIAYYCDLVEVHSECRELLSALEERSPIDVEIAAREVAAAWAQAMHASGAAHRQDVDPLLRRHALIELEVGRGRIARVFAHAFSVTANWEGVCHRLHEVLRGVGTRIGIDVISEAPTDNSSAHSFS